MFTQKAQRILQQEWVEVVRQGQEMIRHRSGNDYIFLRMNNDVPTAQYEFATETIEMSPKYAFGEQVLAASVAKIGFDTQAGKEQWPAATGVLLHETYHARFSREALFKRLSKLQPRESFMVSLAIMLEEARIERLGVDMFPKDKPFLRASSLHIVASHHQKVAEADGKKETEQAQNADEATQIDPVSVYVLLKPRVNGKIITERDVAPVFALMPPTFTDEHKEAVDIAGEAFYAAQTDDECIAIARELAEKLKDVSPEEQRKQQDGMSDEEREAMQKAMEDMMDVLRRMASQTEGNVSKEASEEGRGKPKETKAQQKKRHDAEKRVSDQFFQAGNVRGRTNSTKARSRKPTLEEKRAANEIVRILRKARYKDRVKTKVASEIPPGRLVVSAAVQKSANPRLHVNRWSEVRRHHVEQPKLKLGMLADVSGSMDRAMEPMGSASWIFSNVVQQIEGTAATVYYGQGVIPVLKPGEVQKQVDIWDANDGGHVIGDAFKMLNGSLRIADGVGARLLVVISDAHYQDRETQEAEKAITDCISTGAAVLWMDLTDSRTAHNLCERTGARYIKLNGSVTEAAKLIGQACKEALEAVSPA